MWVSIFPLIIGRTGNINSSSSRCSVFIIFRSTLPPGKGSNVNIEQHIFFEVDFSMTHDPPTIEMHSGCSPLVIEDGISQCCKNGLTDGELWCCIPTVLWLRKKFHRNRMWGRSVVGTLRYMWCIYGVTTGLYTLSLDESTLSATLFGWRGYRNPSTLLGSGKPIAHVSMCRTLQMSRDNWVYPYQCTHGY